MNKARRDKAAITRQANSDKFAAQTVTVDPHWTIFRDDDRNWRIEFNGKFHGFYPTLPAALQALPAKMVSETAKGSLKDVQEAYRAILATIQKALEPVK